MALIRALNAAISGLKAQQTRIDVIGNNIANVDTTGFKESRVDFETILSQTLSFGTAPNGTLGGVDPRQIGLGAAVSKTAQLFTQGSLKATGLASDLAIEDSGGQAHTFFVLKDGDGSPVYTRDGSFSLNPSNMLHNASNGFIVQGYTADYTTFSVVQGGPVTNVVIPVGDLRIARETNEVNFEGNLNGAGSVASSGSEIQSEVLYDNSSGSAVVATAATLLTNLVTLDGTSNVVDPNLQTGQTIELTLTKGTRTLAENFVIGDPPPTGGTTLGDLVTFLQNAMGVNTSTNLYSTSRGNAANGTLDMTAGDSVTTTTTESTIVDAAVDFTAAGVQLGDVLRITSGAGAGQIVTVVANETAASAGFSATGSANSIRVTPLSTAPATGDQYQINKAAGVTLNAFGAPTGTVQINGNAGLVNALTQVELTQNGNRLMLFGNQAAAAGESTFSNALVYDSLGTPRLVEMTYIFEGSSDAGNTFRWFAESDDNFGPSRTIGTGTIQFKPNGQYRISSPDQVNIDLNSTGANTPFIWNPDFTALTGFAQTTNNNGDLLNQSDVFVINQDGFEEGELIDYSIANDGIVTGVFSNGLTRTLAQVVVARFTNPGGLIHQGANIYRVGTNSGLAAVGTPGTAGRGVVQSGSLEESNVDLAKQFTDLIVGQRAFQANARTISVADEMLQELVNII